MSGVSLREPGVRHESALVDPDAELAENVSVGPWSIIGPGVRLAEGVRVGSHVLIEKDTRVGAETRIFKGAVLGTDPQDLKYRGERSHLEIGRRTTIREFATLNRGTAASGTTSVGDDCLIMAYAHVAHDCRLENGVVLANAVNMGGHVEIGEQAIVGGMTAIHQFVRIGRHAFVGGASRVAQDVPPYLRVAGNPCECYGVNTVGLRRRNFAPERIRALRRAHRAIFQSDLNIGRAVEQLEQSGEPTTDVSRLLSFIRSSERGITT